MVKTAYKNAFEFLHLRNKERYSLTRVSSSSTPFVPGMLVYTVKKRMDFRYTIEQSGIPI